MFRPLAHRSVLPMVLGATALVLALTLAPRPAPAGDMTEEQRQQVEEVVRDYLRRNPEVLVEAIRALQAKEEAAEQEKARQAIVDRKDELLNDGYSPVGGNPDGDVTVVEFFDYRCGYCKRVFPSLQKLMKEDGNIRYVFKELPILGPDSVVAARAAMAVWTLDKTKYMAFHTAAMESRGALTEAKVLRLAKEAGLDAEAVAKAMKDPEVDKKFLQTRHLAASLGITGTPAFVIGDTLVPGAVSIEALKQHIANARKG
ncbi:MAG: DsbA family protein [Hyphomicrobiales bacterium]|nr:DsbA family protein [Hyphomicrobiales bacterium]